MDKILLFFPIGSGIIQEVTIDLLCGLLPLYGKPPYNADTAFRKFCLKVQPSPGITFPVTVKDTKDKKVALPPLQG